MKRLIYSLAFMMLAALPSAAQKVEGVQENGVTEVPYSAKANYTQKRKTPSWNPNFVPDGSVTIYYDSYDVHKNKVRMSAKVFWNDIDDKKKHILLSCHPTVTNSVEAPSGSRPIDAGVERMTSEDDSYLVVCPDYCGYGISSHLQHPYLINDVTACNCLDALLPAIQAARDRGVKFENTPDGNGNDRYELNIVGYSQGGATALACAKLIDSDACPEEISKNFRIRQTCCGDGPYSIKETLNTYVEWGDPKRPDGGKDIAYPSVLPLIVQAAKEAYSEGCMRTVEVEDFFTPEFLATGIMADLQSKNLSTAQLNTKIERLMPHRRPVDILSRKILNEDGTFNTETKEYKCFARAMELADLCTGWVPKHDITFFHLPSDDVVPYTNVSKGIMGANGIGKTSDKVKFVDHETAWSDADNLVALAQGMTNPDWSTMVHDVGGQYFYVSYMYGYKLRVKDYFWTW